MLRDREMSSYSLRCSWCYPEVLRAQQLSIPDTFHSTRTAPIRIFQCYLHNVCQAPPVTSDEWKSGRQAYDNYTISQATKGNSN